MEWGFGTCCVTNALRAITALAYFAGMAEGMGNLRTRPSESTEKSSHELIETEAACIWPIGEGPPPDPLHMHLPFSLVFSWGFVTE